MLIHNKHIQVECSHHVYIKSIKSMKDTIELWVEYASSRKAGPAVDF